MVAVRHTWCCSESESRSELVRGKTHLGVRDVEPPTSRASLAVVVAAPVIVSSGGGVAVVVVEPVMVVKLNGSP